jgi:hypothetical protein
MSNKRAHSDGRVLQGRLPGKVGAESISQKFRIFSKQTAVISGRNQEAGFALG